VVSTKAVVSAAHISSKDRLKLNVQYQRVNQLTPANHILVLILVRHLLYERQRSVNNKTQKQGNTMSANSRIKTEERIDVAQETSRFALNAGMGMAALIGVWGLACLFGGLAINGFGGLLRGFWTAVSGN
jgi:hypothetical protein